MYPFGISPLPVEAGFYLPALHEILISLHADIPA